MAPLKMSRHRHAKNGKCCCCFALSTWSLIILLLALLINAAGVVASLIIFFVSLALQLPKIKAFLELLGPLLKTIADFEIDYNFIAITLYYVVKCSFGTFSSVLGIYSLAQYHSKYLMLFYYYLTYELISSFFTMLLIILSPSVYFTMIVGGNIIWLKKFFNVSEHGKIVFAIIGAYLSCIALCTFSRIIIRRFRDSMQKFTNFEEISLN